MTTSVKRGSSASRRCWPCAWAAGAQRTPGRGAAAAAAGVPRRKVRREVSVTGGKLRAPPDRPGNCRRTRDEQRYCARMRVFRLIQPVDDIEVAVAFYGAVLGDPGERIAVNRHYFTCGGV